MEELQRLKSELEKKDIRRVSNKESNRLTKECICTALVFLIAEKDFDKISVTDIIEKSGVSRATFYRNYGTKENVIKDIVSEITGMLQDAFDDPLMHSDPKAWLEKFFADVKEGHKLYRILLKASISYQELFDFSAMTYMGKAVDQMTKYRIIGFLNVLLSVTLEWVEQGMKESEKKMAEIMLSILKV